ncbi:spore germination protein [Sporosarcina sp. YIM B06819]|uniref:spore germination protein n=1 Tax=Sporosarcina sp. YIM B06819 TaxID=3081769 RepID=UPI00298D5C05|nr:spore germination protein [Sporosarcina sp. YIM B06819]
MDDVKSIDGMILYIKNIFHDSADLIVEEIEWQKKPAIICYYSVINEASQVNKELELIRNRAEEGLLKWGETAASTVQAFSVPTLIENVATGSVAVVFPFTNLLLKITIPKMPVRSISEPDNEHVIRGQHGGFVESFETNIGILRKHLAIPDLVVKSMRLGSDTNTLVSYVYIESIANKDVVNDLKDKLENIGLSKIWGTGPIEDYLEDSVWSPFPQFLNTERPDRVIANLLEGKIAVFTDSSPTALIAPVNFFSFYESPDDYNARVLVGSFYRILRLISFMAAIFLPAFYIAVVSFHSEIIPAELGKQVKLAVNDIPYRPIVEALILELFIELIRESAIRLPTPIGQTIGIVGGLVIGNAIVDAGFVSNFMVIVVAMTAISSFVVPSWEMNMSIRLIRFPFMLAAALFGFFGMAIGTLVLFIHLLNLSSLKQPYFTPIIPFDPSRFKDVFFRIPYVRMNKQQKTFTHGADKEGGDR